MTTAETIAQLEPAAAGEAADKQATDRDQDWENEATTFTFADGSKLRISGPEVEIVAHGFTFAQWLEAAGRTDSASEYDLRAAWRAGEDPEEYTR